MSKENDELLKLTSYVQISKYREKTLKSIGDDVKIPTNIAKDSGIRTNHISKVLSELKVKTSLNVSTKRPVKADYTD